MKLEDAIKAIVAELAEGRYSRKVGDVEGKGADAKRREKAEKGKKAKRFPKPGKQKPGFVKEAALAEGHTADPIVDDTAGAISQALLMSLEDDVVGSNAFEMMMGSAPDEDRLTLARLEDVDATAELIVQAVYRHPGLHDKIHQMAAEMLESAMGAMSEAADPLDEVAPPGFEKAVKAMKKDKSVDNPFAVAWSMKKKGYKPSDGGK